MEDEDEEKIEFKKDPTEGPKPSMIESVLMRFFPKKEKIPPFLSCCFPKEVDEGQMKTTECFSEDYLGENVFPQQLIRSDERKIISFDRNGLITYINNLKNKTFVRKYIFEGVKLSVCEDNDFTRFIPIARCEIYLKKSDFTKGAPSIQDLAEAIVKFDIRQNWDTDNYDYDKCKIIKGLKDGAEWVRIVTKIQKTMFDPREIIDKRIGFMEGDTYYYFSSSIPENSDLYPCRDDDVIRVKNYLGTFTIKEDDQGLLIDAFHQVDVEIGPSLAFIVMNLPLKMNQFAEKITKYFNER